MLASQNLWEQGPFITHLPTSTPSLPRQASCLPVHSVVTSLLVSSVDAPVGEVLSSSDWLSLSVIVTQFWNMVAAWFQVPSPNVESVSRVAVNRLRRQNMWHSHIGCYCFWFCFSGMFFSLSVFLDFPWNFCRGGRDSKKIFSFQLLCFCCLSLLLNGILFALCIKFCL